MKNAKLMFIGLISLMACGCGMVASEQPVGKVPEKLEAAAWDGTWIGSEGTLTIRLVDEENGVLQVAITKESDGRLKLETFDVHLRNSGKWLFANVESKDNPEEPYYLWGRIKKEQRLIVFWIPDPKAFIKLVDNKVLPGRTKDNDVFLEELQSQHLEVITSQQSEMLFLWDEPLVFIKLTE